MKFPISWLNDYVDISGVSSEEFAHAMTMSGSKVRESKMQAKKFKMLLWAKF